MFFSNIVLGCMRCLWAGRDSHLYAGADLDCFGIAYGHFGGVRLLQIRALISARLRRRWGATRTSPMWASASENAPITEATLLSGVEPNSVWRWR
jgi:hypothetical protein